MRGTRPGLNTCLRSSDSSISTVQAGLATCMYLYIPALFRFTYCRFWGTSSMWLYPCSYSMFFNRAAGEVWGADLPPKFCLYQSPWRLVSCILTLPRASEYKNYYSRTSRSQGYANIEVDCTGLRDVDSVE